MLQHNIAIHKREALIRKQQPLRHTRHIAAVRILIQLLRSANHLLRNIHAHTRRKPPRQRLRQPSHAAPEVQRRSIGIRQAFHLAQIPHHCRQLDLAGSKEFPNVPSAVRLVAIGENRPQRIALRQRIPVTPQPFQLSQRAPPSKKSLTARHKLPRV